MANTRNVRFITKQTAVTGRIPTGTTGYEDNLIRQGEIAQNTADKKLFGYDGSNVFEFGSNSFLNLSGGTINGNLRVTGNSNLSAITGTSLVLSGAGTIFSVSGTSGGLFSVTDSLSDSLLTINDVLGNNVFKVYPRYSVTNNFTANTVSATTFYGNGAFLTGIVTTNTYVTGGTYSAGTTTLRRNDGGTVIITGYSTSTGTSFTGGTVSGATSFTAGVTSNTISATTLSANSIYSSSLAATAVTSSGIVYVLTDGKLQTDINDLVWDDTNKKFGINQQGNTPTATLDVHGRGTTTGITFQASSSAGTASFSVYDSGSTVVSGTFQVTGNTSLLNTTISGTGTLFSVSGSSGQIFGVTDNLSNSLFVVNDANTNPVLQVYSGNVITMGTYLAPSYNTTVIITANTGLSNIIAMPSTSGLTGAFFDYTINNANTNYRAGTIMSIWNTGTTCQYTETSTNDIGSTTGVTFSVVATGGTGTLKISATTNNWIVKIITRGI